MSLSTLADAMFVVVRMDVIDRPMLRDMARTLNSCPCAKLGFVLTNVEARELYGGASYGQGGKGPAEHPAPLVESRRLRVDGDHKGSTPGRAGVSSPVDTCPCWASYSAPLT